MSLRTNMQLEGMDVLQARMAEVMLAGEGSIEAIGNSIAQGTSQRAKNLIRRSVPSGRLYVRENPRRVVRASAPGQPPAIDTSTLIDSISFRKYSSGSAFAYVSAWYAAELEFGNTKIAPRPFFYPAWLAAIQGAEKRFKAEFESRL